MDCQRTPLEFKLPKNGFPEAPYFVSSKNVSFDKFWSKICSNFFILFEKINSGIPHPPKFVWKIKEVRGSRWILVIKWSKTALNCVRNPESNSTLEKNIKNIHRIILTFIGIFCPLFCQLLITKGTLESENRVWDRTLCIKTL